jgi:uncharacterized protein (TIGR01777 family)
MKVLIMGATGFIGRRLIDHLQANGHAVAGLTRDPQAGARAVPDVEFHPWIPGKAIDSGLVKGADAIVNLAGENVSGRWSSVKKAHILDSRVDSTRALVGAMAGAGGPGVLINASAVGVYGDRGDEVLTESSAPGAGFLKDVVMRWEEEARRAERFGARVVLMRFGIVLGTEGGALQKLLPMAKLGISGPLGSGRQWWPWVHVNDLTGAVEAALVGDLEGVFNVTAPEPMRQRQFASALGAVLRRPALLPAPAFALRLLQGEFADELLYSKRVVPERLLAAGFRFEYPALEPALRNLVHGPGAGQPAGAAAARGGGGVVETSGGAP